MAGVYEQHKGLSN